MTRRLTRSRNIGGALLLAAVGALGLARLGLGDSGVASRHRDQLIPLYDNASPAQWQTACSQSNGSRGGSFVIADAGTGPGPGPVPAWTKVVSDCYRHGRASVIGYVWTNYGSGGTASIPGIEQQIRAWYSYYPGDIAGIFFDGVSDNVPGTSTSNKAFYQTLASYVHTQEGDNDEVVFNFGNNPDSDWMLASSSAKNADIVITFEGSYDTPGSNPYTAWTQAGWENAYPADDFAALVHNAPDATACTALAHQHLGYVYVGTSYDTLPPFWNAFLSAC